MNVVDITAVINAHREGLMAYTSLRSMKHCSDFARDQGLHVELLAVLDQPDEATSAVFEEFAARHPGLRIVTVEYGDLGYSRNAGCENARGEWIAFLDADDLWGENWLVAAHTVGKADPRRVVWHPELCVYFGNAPRLFLHTDMEDPIFNVADLVYRNAWTSLCFTRVSLVREVPYAGTDMRNYIGYEDWGWNIDVMDHGGLHKVVPGTTHAVRTRPSSLVKQTAAAGCVPRPSNFFRHLLTDHRMEK